MLIFILSLITSIFASEFQNLHILPVPPRIRPIRAPFLADEDGSGEIKWKVQIEVHNEDMFAPEFNDIDDELKINIGKIVKKVLPVVIPKIPKIGPIIAPFLSEEDMEPEVIDYDQDELADLVIAELSEAYEMDAGFWKKVKTFVKKIAPVVIKKVVPMIPKVGPIVAPFLGQEDTSGDIKWKVQIEVHNEDMFSPQFDGVDDEFKIQVGKIIKKVLPAVIPKIPTIGPIIAPFLSEEDMEPEVIDYDKDELADLVLAELAKKYEIDAGFWKSVKKFVIKVAPTVIKTVVPMIPKVGPIVAPFLGDEDASSEIKWKVKVEVHNEDMFANMTNPFAAKPRKLWKRGQKPSLDTAMPMGFVCAKGTRWDEETQECSKYTRGMLSIQVMPYCERGYRMETRYRCVPNPL